MTEFEALYGRYAADVFRFALFLSGNRADAEDITSETFVRAWAASDTIRAGTVKAYLFAIARNQFRMLRRRERLRPSQVSAWMADPNPGPADIVVSQIELERVLTTLQRLPESDRAALLMRGQDAMHYEVIASVLEISVAAAKVKVHRARIKLESMLQERKGRT
jgi:RNA polymerase sigma-70 factor (ECF subfamily)